MSEVISPEEIKKTQNSLSKYIKEPPLTAKLLKKPPFRFLHDIIKSVIKETEFLRDVFSEEDLNLNNIKDKEGKIAFLKKLIAALKDATGDSISAKPNKIVAGLEVTKTLELLQAIGKGIALKQSGKANVQKERSENKKNSREKTSGKEVETVKKVKIKKDETPQEADKGKKKLKTNGKENGPSDRKKKDKVEKEKTKRKEEPVIIKNDAAKVENEIVDVKNENKIETNNVEVTKADVNQNLEKENSGNKFYSNDVAAVENAKTENAKLQEESNENNARKEHDVEAHVENALAANKAEENKISNEIVSDEVKKKDENIAKPEKRPSTRRSSSRVRSSSRDIKKDDVKEKSEESLTKKHNQEIKDDNNVPVLGTVDATPISIPKVERPTTARKAPPSARKAPPSARKAPASARAPGIPKGKDRGEVQPQAILEKEPEVKPVDVIIENINQEDDDKENMVIVEAQPIDNDLQDIKLVGNLENEVGENEGALVAQILETKKELEESKQQWDSANQRPVEIEWESVRKQKRDSWEKEINKLRESIQELTRTTNPLGKLFDFIQEDVDSMQRELKSWTIVTKQYKEKLQQEQKLTESTLEKYKKQLAELDSLIEHEQQAVRNIKANIVANDRKIFNVITRANMAEDQ